MSRSAIPPDTAPEAWEFQAEVLRRMGIEGRARLTFDLYDSMREVAEAGIRDRHPDFGPEEIRLEWFKMMMGEVAFREAEPHLIRGMKCREP